MHVLCYCFATYIFCSAISLLSLMFLVCISSLIPTIFLNLFMFTVRKEESTILIESKKPLSILQLTWNSIHGGQNKQTHTTLHVNKNWQIKRNRDSKISFSSVSKSPCKVVLIKIIFKSIYFLSFLSHTSFSKSRFNILSASSIIYK